MRRLWMLLVVSYVFVFFLWSGQLDPRLSKIKSDYSKNSQETLNNLREMNSVQSKADIVRTAGNEVTIHSTLSVSSTAALDLLGINYTRITDTIVTAHIPVSTLVTLEEEKTIGYVQMAYMNEPHNDIAIVKMNTDDMHTAGYYGEDVLVGIIDSGIDYTHQAFKIAGLTANNTRILYLVDQTVTHVPFTVGSFSSTVGRRWTEAEINSGSCTQVDTNGHGTHVAGSFAGYDDGYQARRGSASKANILFVKTNFASSAITEAIRYLYAQAQQIGKPIVINMSLGSKYGPHDGTDLDTKAIDDLIAGSGGNLMIVRSAGNYADDGHHDSATVSTSAVSMPITVPSYTVNTSDYDTMILQFFYDATVSTSIRITNPSSGTTGWLAPSTSASSGTMSDGTGYYVRNYSTAESYNSSIKQIYIELGESTNGDGKYIRPGTWNIELQTASGSSMVHGWIYYNKVNAAFSSPDPDYTLGGGACGNNVIVVGAYVSRSPWVAADGTWSYTGYTQNAIAPFSSRGPTRDGRQKPDITAPGSNILSTKSKDVSVSNTFLPPDGTDPAPKRYQFMQGTSMSSPLASGAIALIKQTHPTWTYSDVINYFKTNSQGTTLYSGQNTWSNIWGWGVLDVTNAIPTGFLDFSISSHTAVDFYAYKSTDAISFSWSSAGEGANYYIYIKKEGGTEYEAGTTASTSASKNGDQWFTGGYGKYQVKVTAKGTGKDDKDSTNTIVNIYYTSLTSPAASFTILDNNWDNSEFILYRSGNTNLKLRWNNDGNDNSTTTYSYEIVWSDSNSSHGDVTVSSDATYEWIPTADDAFTLGDFKNTYATVKMTIANSSTPTDRVYFEKRFFFRNFIWELLPGIYNDDYLQVVALGQNLQGSEAVQSLLRLTVDTPAYDNVLTANGNGLYVGGSSFNTTSFGDAAIFKLYYNNGTTGNPADDLQIGGDKTKATYRLNNTPVALNTRLSFASQAEQTIYTLTVRYPELAGISPIQGDIFYVSKVTSSINYTAANGYKLMKWESGAWRDCRTVTASGYYVLTSGTIPGLKYKTQLSGNHPNPFNPETTITFTLENTQTVTMELFTSKGKMVKTVVINALEGTNSYHWNGKDERGKDLPSGIYYCVLKADGRQFVRKMVMLK